MNRISFRLTAIIISIGLSSCFSIQQSDSGRLTSDGKFGFRYGLATLKYPEYILPKTSSASSSKEASDGSASFVGIRYGYSSSTELQFNILGLSHYQLGHRRQIFRTENWAAAFGSRFGFAEQTSSLGSQNDQRLFEFSVAPMISRHFARWAIYSAPVYQHFRIKQKFDAQKLIQKDFIGAAIGFSVGTKYGLFAELNYLQSTGERKETIKSSVVGLAANLP